jgi:hypothetical protein
MYPQLFAAASRLAPLMSRLGARVGTFGAPGLLSRYLQIQTPQVNEADVGPVQPTGPAPPISGDNLNTPPSNVGANARVAQGFDVFNPWMPPQAPQSPTQPVVTQAPAVTAGAPGVPLPQTRPASAPQAPDPMSWFMRNARMMRDPATGEFIDPQGAADAQVRGPDLISKMMKYLHNKDVG